jgi:hypothetical protein
MDEDEFRVFSREDFVSIQKWAGYREGYSVDKFMLKRGFGNKCYFWDSHSKEWRLLRAGDLIYKRLDGTMFLDTPHKKAGTW